MLKLTYPVTSNNKLVCYYQPYILLWCSRQLIYSRPPPPHPPTPSAPIPPSHPLPSPLPATYLANLYTYPSIYLPISGRVIKVVIMEENVDGDGVDEEWG